VIEQMTMSVAPEQKRVQGGVKMMKNGLVVTISMFLFLTLSGYSLAVDYNLPDTGIDKCYDDDSEITCPTPGQPFYGQDAQYSGPQPSYRDNGDGTVTDLNTGLMWQKGDTQNDAGFRSWQGACDYCATLNLPSGGYSDWRLPNRRELISIVFYGRYNPAINTTYFPNCHSFNYWSSSSSAHYPGRAWYVAFYNGKVDEDPKDFLNYVRCVRGVPISKPNFHDNGNGTVSDSVTGLMWQKGDTQNDAGGRTWEEALDYCECLTLPSGSYSDWRLPNARELESIVDWDHYDPVIDATYFPNCHSSYYWSSTTYPPYPDGAWYVYFYDGYMCNYYKDLNYYVRCVRGGPFEHYVEPLGDCGGLKPCYSTIQAAMNTAKDRAIIKVAVGEYQEVPEWKATGMVTISGGWKTDFTGQTGMTEVYAPRSTAGGTVKVLPNIRVVPKP